MRKPRGVDPKARPSVWEEDPLGQEPLLQPTGLCSASQSSITPPPIASLSHLPPSHTHSLTEVCSSRILAIYRISQPDLLSYFICKLYFLFFSLGGF